MSKTKPESTSPLHLEDGLNRKRTSVSVHGFALLALSFQALGIIYSDIGSHSFRFPVCYQITHNHYLGTSPLYALNGIWPTSGPAPSREDVIGGISAIIWALTLLPLIKYVCHPFCTTTCFRLTYSHPSLLDRFSFLWNSVPMKVCPSSLRTEPHLIRRFYV